MRKIFSGKYRTTFQRFLILFGVVYFAAVVSAQDVQVQRIDGAPNQRRPGERFFGGERRPPNGESPRQPFPRRNRPDEAAGNIGATGNAGNVVNTGNAAVGVNTPNAGAVNVERNERSIQRLREFDTNKNGILEQNEIADPQRRENINRIVTRLGGNPNQVPININELAKQAATRAGAITPPDGLPGDPLVPYFGEKELERDAILEFGVRGTTPQSKTTAGETAAKPKTDKLTEIKTTMTKFDTNHNGTIDKDKGEWNGLPFDANKADVNKDGRISMDELATALGGGVSAGSPALVKVKPSIPYERLPEGVPPWFFDRDSDQDAQLTMLEYANGEELNDRIASEFIFLDKNNDGFATIAEIFQTLKQVDEEKQKQEDTARRERELKLGNANSRTVSTMTPGNIPVNNSNTPVNPNPSGTIVIDKLPTPEDGSPPPPPPLPSVNDSEGKPIQVERIEDPYAPFGFTDRIADPSAPGGFVKLPHLEPNESIDYNAKTRQITVVAKKQITIVEKRPLTPSPDPPDHLDTQDVGASPMPPSPAPPPSPPSTSNTGSWSPGSPTSASGSSGNNSRAGNGNSRTWNRERNGDRQNERRSTTPRRSR